MKTGITRFIFSFIILAFVYMPETVFAQAKVGAINALLPDTAFMQNFYPIKVTVRNTGNAVYNAPIDVYYAVDSLYVPVLLGTIPATPLNPNDTVSLSTGLLIDSTRFQDGNNIVVVWPTGSGITTSSSEWNVIFVPDSVVSSVADHNLAGEFSVFPNPSNGPVLLQSFNKIWKIEIVNLLGENMASMSELRNAGISVPIDFSSVPAGIYFIRIISEKGVLTKKISIIR